MTFEAFDLALELARELGPFISAIARRDRDMANQLRRAATSIVSCLAEGRMRAGRDRLHLYRVSAGSAAEVKAQLELSITSAYLGTDEASGLLELADRVVAMTWRLTHPRR